MAVQSSVRIWQNVGDYITLTYATARVHYEQSGERVRDRRGLVHAVRPSGERYPCALTLGILAEELAGLNCPGAQERLSVLDWLERMFRYQADLLVFLRGETLAQDGSVLTRNLGYFGFIDSLPEEYFGTLAGASGWPEYVELRFHVKDDGRFSNFEDITSYSSYSPTRLGWEG
jgi:hypothetical protein